ncbi:MAG: hypothetical protein ACOCV8_00960 [Spirochaetota bacterium]
MSKFKKKNNIICFILIMLLSITMITCSSGNYGYITDNLDKSDADKKSTLIAPISINNIPEDKTMVISRIVYYMEDEHLINNTDKVELGFIPAMELIYTKKRVKLTNFYSLKMDSEGYFFMLIDDEPTALSYISLGINDKLYTIPSSAILDIDDSDNCVYAGEIHIIIPDKKESKANKKDKETYYKVNTFFEFYNNQDTAFEHLSNAYNLDTEQIEVNPFIEPFQDD